MHAEPRLGIGLYTPDLACRLTNVPGSTLAAWRRSGLLTPSVHSELPRAGQLYTYDELGVILLIRELRGRGVSMHRLRIAVRWLETQTASGERWTNRRLWTDGKDIYTFADAGIEVPLVASRAGQGGFAVFLPDVLDGLFNGPLSNIREYREYVEISPDIQAGQPVVRGTRLTTLLIAGIAGQAVDIPRVRDVYPELSDPQINAAVRFETELGRLAA